MKKHDQILCNFQGEEVYGGATCPYCGKRSILGLGKGGRWILVSPCGHADMPVDAGGMQIAIHFVNNGSL